MVASVLALHAAYIAWVVFGAFSPRGRPRLAAFHVATLVYGMIIEIFGFWCPLTELEEWLEVRANVPAYRGPFLLHYLDAGVIAALVGAFALLSARRPVTPSRLKGLEDGTAAAREIYVALAGL